MFLLILAAGDCKSNLDTDAAPRDGGVIIVDGAQVSLPNTEDFKDTYDASVAAVPNPGFLFSHWVGANGNRISGDDATSPTITVDMSSARTRTAVFIQDPDFVLEEHTALIIKPANEAIFQDIESITFDGRGDDPEDGDLTGDSLVWRSDLDGELGTGESITASLSGGSHTITLTATDSQQATGSESVTIILEIVVNSAPTPNISGPVAGQSYSTEGDLIRRRAIYPGPQWCGAPILTVTSGPESRSALH